MDPNCRGSLGDRPGLDVYLCACLLPAGRGTQAGTGRRHSRLHASRRTSKEETRCRHPRAGWRLAGDKKHTAPRRQTTQEQYFTKHGRLVPTYSSKCKRHTDGETAHSGFLNGCVRYRNRLSHRYEYQDPHLDDKNTSSVSWNLGLHHITETCTSC